MNKAYISISYSKRKTLNNEVDTIKKILAEFGINPFVFVDTYTFTAEQEKTMMLQAFKDIDNSDFLIAETTDKGIGIGIEVGYAVAKNKPVIYVRRNDSEHSTTVSGASDYHIFYKDNHDLAEQLRRTLKTIELIHH